MAGTVVDTLISDAASAAGVAPRITKGGTLNVGVSSYPPSIPLFNGWQGHFDAAGFYVGSAIFDPLFYINATANGYLPGLATKAVASNSFKTWTLTLRNGVSYHDGTPFNAANVVHNYAKRGIAVNLAIQGIINSVVATGPMTVVFQLALSFFTFPYSLAEQQVTFMAANSQLDGTHVVPVGTGAFKVLGGGNWPTAAAATASLVKNGGYWRKDSTGGALPYLNAINFLVDVDEGARQSSLNSGGIDIAPFYNGQRIKQNRANTKLVKVDDFNGLREPARNLVLCNMGHATSPIKDVRIRGALARVLNRVNYLSVVDGNLGEVADGIFRKASIYYKNPNYPALSLTQAKSLVNAWKSANGGKTPSVAMSYVAGSSVTLQQFNFVKAAAATCGITITAVTYTQDVLINEVIAKNYEVAGWAQFGAVVPATNYVWWSSTKIGAKYYPDYVNFAQQADPLIEAALRTAVAASTVAGQKTAWGTVNSRFAIDLPYLWLDTTTAQWASRTYVQNWQQPKVPALGTSPKSTALGLNIHNGGIPDWASVWHS
jgi:peptide/nickel transport system substrate-binding protein